MVTRARNNFTKPKQYMDGIVRYPISHALFAASITQELELTCHSSAIKDPNLRKAISVEFDALLKNQTWTLVSPSSAQNMVGCEWMFKLKRKAIGSMIVTRLGSLLRVFINKLGLTMVRLIVRLLNPQRYDWFCHLLSLVVGHPSN